VKDKQFVKWQQTMAKGQARFVLLHGVIGWGFPMFVFMTFFFGDHTLASISTTQLLTSLVIWGIGGLGFGVLMWRFSVSAYNKELKKRQS
tara:strand:- start:95 stop:364 length:270 start_codon:yes stop_codon:yes gene_type:complete